MELKPQYRPRCKNIDNPQKAQMWEVYPSEGNFNPVSKEISFTYYVWLNIFRLVQTNWKNKTQCNFITFFVHLWFENNSFDEQLTCDDSKRNHPFTLLLFSRNFNFSLCCIHCHTKAGNIFFLLGTQNGKFHFHKEIIMFYNVGFEISQHEQSH